MTDQLPTQNQLGSDQGGTNNQGANQSGGSITGIAPNAPFYERWFFAYKKATQVPMLQRSTSRLGILASPAFLSGFIRLSIGTGLGAFGTTMLDDDEIDKLIYESASISEKVQEEATKASTHLSEVQEYSKKITAISQKMQNNKNMGPLVEELHKVAEASASTAEAEYKKAQNEADQSTKAVKEAKHHHSGSNAKNAHQTAEKSHKTAEAASLAVEEAAKEGKLLLDLCELAARGVDPKALVEVLKKTAEEEAVHIAEAAKDAQAQLTLLEKSDNTDDASKLTEIIDSHYERAETALAEFEEALKVVAIMQKIGTTMEAPQETMDYLATTKTELENSKGSAEASAKSTEETQKKAHEIMVKLGLEEESPAVAEAAVKGAGSSGSVAVLGVIAWLIGKRASKKGLEKEQERKKSVLFPIKGFEIALNQTPQKSGHLVIKVAFSGALPDVNSVRQALNTYDAKSTIESKIIEGNKKQKTTQPTTVFEIKRQSVQSIISTTNYAAYIWLTGVIEKVLNPLHSQTPIKQVEISTTPLVSSDSQGSSHEEHDDSDDDDGFDD